MVDFMSRDYEDIKRGAKLIVEINSLLMKGGEANKLEADKLKDKLNRIEADRVRMIHVSGILRRGTRV